LFGGAGAKGAPSIQRCLLEAAAARETPEERSPFTWRLGEEGSRG